MLTPSGPTPRPGPVGEGSDEQLGDMAAETVLHRSRVEAIGTRTGWRSGRSQAEGARGKREKEVLKNKHDMLACLVFIG